jgi:hypothetical protein
MYKKFLLLGLVAGALSLNNCKPTDGGDPVPTEVIAPETTIPPGIKNVDGVFMAINTITKTSGVELEIGTAHAAFYKNQNSATKLDGGTVSVNAKTLTKSDDNTYFYAASATEKGGIDYNSQINWVSTGNTSNGLASIGDNDGTGFPNLPVLSEVINLDKTMDNLINWATGFGGDSVIFIIKGPSATFKKVLPSNTTKYTLPMAEIAKIGTGTGTIYVINYKALTKTYGGKNYAFIKQSIAVCSKTNIE